MQVSSDDDEEKEEEKKMMENACTHPPALLPAPASSARIPLMLHLLILAWPVLVPACFRICCRRPRPALAARPSGGQVRPGEERASADVQMSCPGLLEEGQHGYVLRPLARHQRRVRRYEGEREAPHQQRAQQRQALPLHLA